MEEFRKMPKNVSRETKSLKKPPSIQLFLDVSSTNTGVVILKENNDVLLDNINLQQLSKPSCMKREDYEKIKIGVIKEYLDTLKKSYKIDRVYMEGIFIQPKFLKSSQMLLKLHGFLMGYFLDTHQYFISPSSIKKKITGKGNAKKEDVKRVIEEYYGVHFDNEDISDAFAIMICELGYQDFKIKEEKYGLRKSL